MAKETLAFSIPELKESHDTKKLKKSLDTLRGVFSVSVNSKTKEVEVDFDSSGVDRDAILHQVEISGFSAQEVRQEPHVM